ncbi:MAG TPA: hypothetical protein VFZ23_11540 [Pyrinomonadaceae bacterium]
MIHRSELLDPTSVDRMTEHDIRVLDGSQNAGHGPRFLNLEHYPAGALQQVVNASAIKACACGGPGCDSDISDGHSTLRDVFDDICMRLANEGVMR